MAHRGRLNVLANIVGKSYGEIFSEFEGNLDPESVQGSGDVKYHKGATGRLQGRLGRDARADDGRPTPRTSRPSTPSSRAWRAPSRTASSRHRRDESPRPRCRATRCSPCSSTATPRSPARAWSPRPSTSPGCRGTAPAARCTSSSTTRSGSRPPPASGPHVVLRDRRGQDGPVADLPRERRRPRGVRARDAARVRLPRGVPQGRRRRPRLLPALRPQRGRRPELHPAAHVQGDRREALGAQALHRGARAPRRPHASTRPSRRSTTSKTKLQAVLDEVRERPVPGAARRAGTRRCPMDPAAPRDRRRRSDAARASPPRTTAVPDGLHPPPEARAPVRGARRAGGERATIDWSLGRGARDRHRCSLEGTDVRLVGQDTRRGTFSQRHAVLVDYETGAAVRAAVPPRRRRPGASRSATRCSASTPRSASSTATRSSAPTRSSPGRRSSATS